MSDKGLTPGEIRVLKTYCEAETHAEAAAILEISVQTLKNHLGSIYRKTGARKAHSALYRLCLAQGFDPFGTVVVSEGTNEASETGPKAPDSPGQYLVNGESAALGESDTQL